MPYPPNLCTSVQSVGVFVGGYGIPAIPTPPSEFLPQNPFQVCLRKSSHRLHRIHRSFRRRIFSHGSRNSQKLQAENILPRNSRNSQKFLAEDILPHRIHRSFRRRIFSTEFTEYTEASGGEKASQDFRCTQIFFSASRFCVFRAFCGKIVLWLRGYGRDAIPS